MKAENNYIVGFIDMMVSCQGGSLYLNNISYDVNGRPEKLLADFEERGLPQLCCSKSKIADFCFEVKTKIPSLGELIRQINMYREYVPALYYVVSSDDKFVPQLNAQEIGFVKYPTGELFGI